MPAPLLWLGAAAISVYAGNKLNTAHLREKKVLGRLPGDCSKAVELVNGSIVTCGIFEVLDHTGIWFDGTIYELNGSGLVRCVSPKRFLHNRSGEKIYTACSPQGHVLAEPDAVERCRSQLFTLYDYHVLRQNCHKFVAEMICAQKCDVTSFSDLNSFLSTYFDTVIDWRLADVNLN